MHLRLDVNGSPRDVDVPEGTSLLTVLREDLGLCGSRYGCGEGACGACFVLVDGKATASCTMPAEQSQGHEIFTIEGLGHGEELHPVQRAFIEEDAMQCGYCTSGLIVSSAALLARTPEPTENEIREALSPHLCRCGIHQRAIRAVQRASR